MIYYDRIDVPEEIGDNKAANQKCNICYYWKFLDKVFKFQPDICNGYHDVLIKYMNLNDVPSLNIQDADYFCIISRINKSEAVKVMQNVYLTEKSGILQNIKIYHHI